ncbi:iron-sulfur cluster biosynthesis protein [Lentzea sp. PSKA42]|uniref:Iron-sulfur cluster biosynthesis protein n=1 Tax=Lentzea indica TaxID=2604800 RepID=A0ABX1FR20_9PSEU|nr:iron-sulfur cluster biosynthesis protein [Lentzea indica]NKE61012.1 iron-sulfur cluster biosynthesis protein [Lentzea indica]
MLEISSAAASAIDELTGSAERAGLRIRITAETDAGAALEAAVTEQSGPDDQLIRADSGARVFIEPAAALYLTDKVLDVHKDVDGKVQFTFHGKV